MKVKMLSVLCKEFPQTRRFGVELELSNNLTKKEIGDILVEYENIHGIKKSVNVTHGPEGWAHTINK